MKMRLPPADVVASWPPPDYENPDTQGPRLLIIQMILMPLALVALIARLYARVYLMKKAWIDDWLMLAAMTLVIGTTIAVILATEVFGWKIHVWDLTKHQLEHGRKASITAQTLFLPASGLAKLSILTSYLRIAPYDSWFRRLTISTMPLVGTLMLAFLILLWTQCSPASDYWHLSDNSHCIDEGPPLIGQAVTSVITDFMVYVLPLPTLRSLNLPKRQRVALIIVFSLGFVVVFAGCMRTYWVVEVVNDTYDVTWNGFCMWFWVAVEVNLGVICGCVPTLRPLFKYFQNEIRRSSGTGRDTQEQQDSERNATHAPWFGSLHWLEGPNWLGSLAATPQGSRVAATVVDPKDGAITLAPRRNESSDFDPKDMAQWETRKEVV
jgi:hypothetical protein